MIPCIAIPALNRPDLLRRCIESIDFPIGTLLIIDNGGVFSDADTSSLPRGEGEIHHAKMHGNLGFAGSCNFAMDHTFSTLGRDAVLIVGNDIEFAPGDLAIFWQTVIDFPAADFVYGNHSFGNFLVKRSGFEKVGWFDENYELGYCEDGDFWRRLILSGAKAIHAAGLHAKHEGSATINSDKALKRVVQAQQDRNWDYYSRKWGCPKFSHAKETFASPFNDINIGLNSWTLSAERQTRPHYRTHG